MWVWYIITAYGWNKNHKSLFLFCPDPAFRKSPSTFLLWEFWKHLFCFWSYIFFLSPALLRLCLLCFQWQRGICVTICHHKTLLLMILDNDSIKDQPVGKCWGYQCNHLPHRTLCPCYFLFSWAVWECVK